MAVLPSAHWPQWLSSISLRASSCLCSLRWCLSEVLTCRDLTCYTLLAVSCRREPTWASKTSQALWDRGEMKIKIAPGKQRQICRTWVFDLKGLVYINRSVAHCEKQKRIINLRTLSCSPHGYTGVAISLCWHHLEAESAQKQPEYQRRHLPSHEQGSAINHDFSFNLYSTK